jgi:hypothetical protein
MKRNLSLLIVIFIVLSGIFFLAFFYYESNNSTVVSSLSTNSNKPGIPTNQLPEQADKIIITETSKPASPPSLPTEPKQKFVNQAVPFTSQAPTGQWSDERQQDGCEEASALMAMYWVQGKSLSSQEALTKILDISDYEQKTYGEHRDISLNDVNDWILKDYFKFSKASVVMNIHATDIIKEINSGNIILLPMNGQKLHNPYFTAPGPERHMILVRGYDSTTDEFITNDPGTKRGEGYRYSAETIMQAILVYPTGSHEPADESLKGMIVIKK